MDITLMAGHTRGGSPCDAKWRALGLSLAFLASFAPSAFAAPIPPVPGSESLAVERIVIMLRTSALESSGGEASVTWDGQRGELVDGILQALTEAMRAKGWKALGYENVVFGQDEGANARYLLGGTLTTLTAVPGSIQGGELNGSIEWQLLDRRSKKVVAKSTHPGIGKGMSVQSGPVVVQFLADSLGAFLGTMDVVALLVAERDSDSAAGAALGPLQVACARGASVGLPEDLPKAMAAVVTIRAGGSLGSGVLVSSDGFLLTAAHVVGDEKEVEVSLENGTTLPGKVLRSVAARREAGATAVIVFTQSAVRRLARATTTGATDRLGKVVGVRQGSVIFMDATVGLLVLALDDISEVRVAE